MRRAGSKRLLRDLNYSLVLNLIGQHGPLSRTEIARRSGLTAATITRITGTFVAAGLLVASPAPSSGGRRRVLLQINPRAGYVIGVKLHEDRLTLALCDLASTVVYSEEVPLTPDAAPTRAISAIAAAIDSCIARAGVPRDQVFGIGVGLPGLIDSAQGLCRYSAFLGWRDVPIGPALAHITRLPVRVDNDVNALAVAERQFGEGREAADFVLLVLGRGIGMSAIVGGEVYRGARGGAGEVGHMTIDSRLDAPLCTCGKRGCLEAIAADYGIVRAALGVDPGHQVEEQIGPLIASARAGDERIRAIFLRAGAALGQAIANLINILDPALVILTGEGVHAGDLLLEPLRLALPRHLFGRSADEVPLVVCPTDWVTWARGAASLVLRDVFRPPIYESEEPLIVEGLLVRGRMATERRAV